MPGGEFFAAQRTDRVKPKPFNLLLGRRVTPNSHASAVGELGCFDIGLIGYINRELCPALTQQELRNILVIHRANGLRWHADRLEAAGNGALRQQRAQRHVRALATRPASPLCGSADPISANEHSPIQIQIVAISPNGAILVNVGFLETKLAFLGKKYQGFTFSEYSNWAGSTQLTRAGLVLCDGIFDRPECDVSQSK